MAYVPLTEEEILSGKPVSSSTMDKVKDDLDDLNTRLQNVELGGLGIFAPINFTVNGRYEFNLNEYLVSSTTNFQIQINGVYLTVVKAGTSGTTEIDVEYKNGAGAWTSCLSTKPTVAFGAGDYATSSNGVVHSTNKIVNSGGFLRLKLTQAQRESYSIIVRIDYEKV